MRRRMRERFLSERRAHLDDVKTISAYAKDMRDFLNDSELTERRAFIESVRQRDRRDARRRPDAIHRSHARR